VKNIGITACVALFFFITSFLIPVIGAIIAVPMAIFGAWIYNVYKK
jgi:hypothetical protein